MELQVPRSIHPKVPKEGNFRSFTAATNCGGSSAFLATELVIFSIQLEETIFAKHMRQKLWIDPFTHGGMDTTLEYLNNGVPMLAIPIANDQPAIAARVVWARCGEAIPVKKVSVSKLRTLINKVLTEASYRQNAVKLQASIHRAGGASKAIDK